jgi:hypothetical protein
VSSDEDEGLEEEENIVADKRLFHENDMNSNRASSSQFADRKVPRSTITNSTVVESIGNREESKKESLNEVHYTEITRLNSEVLNARELLSEEKQRHNVTKIGLMVSSILALSLSLSMLFMRRER